MKFDDSKYIKDDSKRCRSCKQWFNHREYNKSNFTESGLQPSCRPCTHKSMKRLRKWQKSRRAVLNQIISRYPCQSCGEPQVSKLVFRNHMDNTIDLTARSEWGTPADLHASCQSHTVQCKRCIGSKKPLPDEIPLELTQEEIDALMARRETKLSKALAKGKKTKNQGLMSQFDKILMG